jgi:filamentous hemagglutinin family protein
MKPDDYLLCFSSSLIFSYLAVSIPAQAQIASDNSMSVPTQVIRQSDKLFEIIGGTEVGSNLFHSFAEFSVSEENIARFINNNPAILNVINRVTGASASEIFGKIEAGGTAPNFNLFLLNPNGIIFGPNAALDIKGSFVATTANAIQFGNRGFFSASSPNDPSMLTVQPSAFFFNQVRPNSILNQSRHQTETESGDFVSVGLQVPNDKSLLLLGGDVTIDGGMLTAPNSRVELGGLAGTGTVGLNIDDNNFSLSFPDSLVPSDLLLTNGAKVDVTDRGGGSITINARNIEIAGVSKL